MKGVALERALRTLLSILLFCAHKAIILHWERANIPTLSFWKSLLNKMKLFLQRGLFKYTWPKTLIRFGIIGFPLLPPMPRCTHVFDNCLNAAVS